MAGLRRPKHGIFGLPPERVFPGIAAYPDAYGQRFRAWEESGATGLTVRSRQPEAIAVMAEAARLIVS